MKSRNEKIGSEILDVFSERISTNHTALLVIDMQKDFCLDGYAASNAGRPLGAVKEMIPRLEEFLSIAREEGVLICHIGFWTLQDHLSDSPPWLAQRRRSTYAPDLIALENSEGAAFIEELKPIEGELEIRKHRYSGFKGTDLDMVLRANSIKTVIVTGLSTNVCVEGTIRDAFEHGYYTCLPQDLCASWDSDLHESTLKNVNARFGLVSESRSIIDAWSDLKQINQSEQ